MPTAIRKYIFFNPNERSNNLRMNNIRLEWGLSICRPFYFGNWDYVSAGGNCCCNPVLASFQMQTDSSKQRQLLRKLWGHQPLQAAVSSYKTKGF